jgi:hypothetical protein
VVLLEDDDNAVKEFCEQDIETILDSRARTRVVEGQGEGTQSWLNKRKANQKTSKTMFTGASAMEHATIDVNDPDFWKKVLPDLVTPDMMIDRMGDLVVPSDNEDEKEEEDEQPVIEGMDKFMQDMVQMIEGILDLQRRGNLPDRERNTSMKLLLRMTLKPDLFDEDQILQAQEWLTILEGTRRRGQRQDVYLEDSDGNGAGSFRRVSKGSRRGGGAGSRGGPGSRGGKVKVTSSGIVGADGEIRQRRKRRRAVEMVAAKEAAVEAAAVALQEGDGRPKKRGRKSAAE